MNKAVVLGGSGFLGSHVADHLSSNGYEVTIFDNVRSKWASKNQNMIEGDILDFKNLNEAIKGSEVVYNFAALADLNEAIKEPLKTVNINILGNVNALEACRIQKVKRFIYASSIYVYSREGSFYRCSKEASESYVEEYFKSYGLEYTILRFGSLYGPRTDESNGLRRVIKSALDTGMLSYDGDPSSMREYIHVEDASLASVRALEEEFKNESVVLTGHEPMKVMDMLLMLCEILGLPESSVSFSNKEYAGHYIRTPYTYKSKVSKKYIPSMHVDLGQGLIQLIEEIKSEDSDG